jgi:hypothetical protein
MTRPVAGWVEPQDALARLNGRLFATVQEVSAVLGRDAQGRGVRAAIEAGEIPALKVGLKWHVPTAWLRKAAGLDPDMEVAGPAA